MTDSFNISTGSGFIILPSAVRAATNVSGFFTIPSQFAGFALIINITAVTAAQTIDPSIEFLDPASGVAVTLFDITAYALARLETIIIHPFSSAWSTAGAEATAVSPPNAPVRFRMTHSGAGNFTYSVGGVALP